MTIAQALNQLVLSIGPAPRLRFDFAQSGPSNRKRPGGAQ